MLRTLLCMAALLAAGAARAAAQDFETVSTGYEIPGYESGKYQTVGYESDDYQSAGYESAGYSESRVDALERELRALREEVRSGAVNTNVGGCDGDDCDGGCCCCWGRSGWVFEAEATFFKYHRNDGVRIGDDTNQPSGTEGASADFEAAPRLAVGYVGCNGFGVRARWWDYDHDIDANEPESFMSVDTFTVDLEVFKNLPLWCGATLQISGGFRYNKFQELSFDSNPDGQTVTGDFWDYRFDGYGGILGMELWQAVGCHGAVFLRGRGAILMDERFIRREANGGSAIFNQSYLLEDTVVSMAEIALGYSYLRPVGCATYFVQGTLEWQVWNGYVGNYVFGLGGQPEDLISSNSDIGFGGFAVSTGLTY